MTLGGQNATANSNGMQVLITLDISEETPQGGVPIQFAILETAARLRAAHLLARSTIYSGTRTENRSSSRGIQNGAQGH